MGRLQQTDGVTLVDNGQTPIHALVQGHALTGEAGAGRQWRQCQNITEKGNGVVIGHRVFGKLKVDHLAVKNGTTCH